MCSLPPRESIAAGWFSSNIAENDNAVCPSQPPSTRRHVKQRRILVCDPTHKPLTSASPLKAHKLDKPIKQAPRFMTPQPGIRVPQPFDENTRQSHLDPAGPTSTKGMFQSDSRKVRMIEEEEYQSLLALKRRMAAGEKFERRLREDIQEALSTRITNLQPGDIKPKSFLVVNRDLSVATEDGWQFVDDPRFA